MGPLANKKKYMFTYGLKFVLKYAHHVQTNKQKQQKPKYKTAGRILPLCQQFVIPASKSHFLFMNTAPHSTCKPTVVLHVLGHLPLLQYFIFRLIIENV